MQSIPGAFGRGATALALVAASLLLAAAPARAQLRLDITQGVRDAVPIAVVPFGGQAEGAATDVAAVVANDLRMSGRFAPLERRDMVARPTAGADIRFEDWRLLKSDFIVVGRVEPDRGPLRAAQRAHRRVTARAAAAVLGEAACAPRPTASRTWCSSA